VGEEELRGAVRELKEETGIRVETSGRERDLGVFRLRSGKQLHVWALEHDFTARF
jgi:predicted NUDIX family NTP pyrophosphohydrolase